MPHGNYKGRDMVCPFYRGESDNSITCEGMVRESRTEICFAGKERKAYYAARRCKDIHGYKDCLYAKALMEKYEG